MFFKLYLFWIDYILAQGFLFVNTFYDFYINNFIVVYFVYNFLIFYLIYCVLPFLRTLYLVIFGTGERRC